MTDAWEQMDIEVDGARLACRVAGPDDGEPVLMLHGYLGSHMAWRRVVAPLVEGGYRVVAPDWFGWGDSEIAATAAYDDEVERIGLLADALGWEAFNLFGHDYGGFIGLGFAQQHPERIRRLAILNSRAHQTFSPLWYAIFKACVLIARFRLTRLLFYVMPIVWIHRMGTRSELRRGIFDERAFQSYTANLNAATLAHLLADYRVPARPELSDGLDDLDCPARIIWGERDVYLSPDIARDLAERIPNAELTMLEDAGHFITDERPDEVAGALVDLLAKPCSP